MCAVLWGVFSTVGGYLEYRGGCSVPWGDHDKCGGDIMSTVGVFSTVGDIMSTMGGYLEYRGDVQYRGGYHDARGDIMMHIVPWRVFSTVGGS